MLKIITVLRRAGEKAGAAKWPREFKIPIMRAVSPMRKRYGNIIRVRPIVRASFSGSAPKPGAMRRTKSGAPQIPIAHTTDSITASDQKVVAASRKADGRPCCVRVSVKTGMKAAERAPSPKSSRAVFGMRKATKNASAASPAPKVWAISMSRTYPRTRLTNVAPLTTEAAAAKWCGGASGSNVLDMRGQFLYKMCRLLCLRRIHAKHKISSEAPAPGEKPNFA